MRFIRFEATNTGDRNTTLQNLTLVHFEGKRWSWKAFRKMPRTRANFRNLPWSIASTNAVIAALQTIQPMPVELKPGAVWAGLVAQTDFEKDFRTGLLYFQLHHSHTRKPLRARAIFR